MPILGRHKLSHICDDDSHTIHLFTCINLLASQFFINYIVTYFILIASDTDYTKQLIYSNGINQP